MLEEKIEKLTAAIESLNKTIQDMNTQMQDPIKLTVTDALPEAQGEAIKPAPLSVPGAEVILLEDLTAICTAIVKKNKTDGAKIKAVLKRYGAELLKNVAVTDYAALKAELVAI